MASKESAVGKGNAGEMAYDRYKKSLGWTVIIKSTRTMVKIPGKGFVQKTVDLGNAFDRIYVRDNEIEFAQPTVRSALSSHKKRIEENFDVIFTLPCFHVTIPLWRKVPHGKVERFEFDIVEWVYSESLKKMVWVERQERL